MYALPHCKYAVYYPDIYRKCADKLARMRFFLLASSLCHAREIRESSISRKARVSRVEIYERERDTYAARREMREGAKGTVTTTSRTISVFWRGTEDFTRRRAGMPSAREFGRYTSDRGIVHTAGEVKSNRWTKLRRRLRELSPFCNLAVDVSRDGKLLASSSSRLATAPCFFFSSTERLNLI